MRGGVILGAFSASLIAAIGTRMFGLTEVAGVLIWINALLGIGVAAYTALLFAQCKGRDLWESKWLGPHLLVQAVLCGSVVLIPFTNLHGAILLVAAISAALHGVLALIERFGSHATANAKQAAAFLGTVRLGPFKAFRESLIIGVALTILVTFYAARTCGQFLLCSDSICTNMRMSRAGQTATFVLITTAYAAFTRPITDDRHSVGVVPAARAMGRLDGI